jgi:methanogenic corrinoid protein MtbC1
MDLAETFAQYLEHIFVGKRNEARGLVEAALDRGICAKKIIYGVVWPAMEQIEKLYRDGRVSRLVEHMATRINRLVADQLQAHLVRKPKTGMRLVVGCGDGEVEELGAQMTADMFESEGWSVWFLGSGVPNDEFLHWVGRVKPDVLCIYGTQPCGVPNIRRLIDTIREVNVCDQMQILLTGGVFNRAPGLDEEVRADLFAPNLRDAIKVVAEHPVRIPKPDLPQPGRRRKRMRKVLAHVA